MSVSEDVALQVSARERQLLQGEVRRSRTALDALLAEDFLEIGRSGRLYHRQEVIGSLMANPIGDVIMMDLSCRQLSDSVVLLTYRSYRAGSMATDRRTTLRSSIWTLIDGDWKIVFHQGTPAD